MISIKRHDHLSHWNHWICAIQAHGAAGVSDDFPLASAWAHSRTIRLADGPDEVHREAIAKLELAKDKHS